MKTLTQESIALLDQLIATPSSSRDEAATADIIEAFLKARVRGKVERIHNNVFVRTPLWGDTRPTLVMNSHHDTVRPSASYTRDPYAPTHEEGRAFSAQVSCRDRKSFYLICRFRFSSAAIFHTATQLESSISSGN